MSLGTADWCRWVEITDPCETKTTTYDNNNYNNNNNRNNMTALSGSSGRSGQAYVTDVVLTLNSLPQRSSWQANNCLQPPGGEILKPAPDLLYPGGGGGDFQGSLRRGFSYRFGAVNRTAPHRTAPPRRISAFLKTAQHRTAP